MRKRIAVIGGDFNEVGGKPSRIVEEIGKGFITEVVVNGGTLEYLKEFVDKSIGLFDAVIWMPNISNDEVKIVDRLKAINPHMVLVQSKRRIETDYSDFELVKRALKSHSQLLIAIDKNGDGGLCFSLIDPLGNLWADKCSLSDMIRALKSRLELLMSCTRIPSKQWNPRDVIYDDFLRVVRVMSQRFDACITAVNPDRFLGNVSTRCCLGFPSTRLGGDHILVSRRNVSKADITREDFVEVWEGTDGTVHYFGNHKPSVDAPIQLRLFRMFHRINHIFHGHCYVKGAPFTKEVVPCGSLDEVGHVLTVVPDLNIGRISVNLLGHGCLIMSDRLDYIESVELESRPFPEKHCHEPATARG